MSAPGLVLQSSKVGFPGKSSTITHWKPPLCPGVQGPSGVSAEHCPSVQVSSAAQAPHVPPQPSPPHCFPAQAGVHSATHTPALQLEAAAGQVPRRPGCGRHSGPNKGWRFLPAVRGGARRPADGHHQQGAAEGLAAPGTGVRREAVVGCTRSQPTTSVLATGWRGQRACPATWRRQLRLRRSRR